MFFFPKFSSVSTSKDFQHELTLNEDYPKWVVHFYKSATKSYDLGSAYM
jgi:hypothetical protein